MRAARVRDDRGAATAELALCLPMLVALTIGLVWLLSVGETQVRVVDAAREAARAAARGDATGAAEARGAAVVPGSTVTVRLSDGEAVARAEAGVQSPGGLLRFLPAVWVHAQAVAAVEPP
jgi:Flp pilus assembly protein TadG